MGDFVFGGDYLARVYGPGARDQRLESFGQGRRSDGGVPSAWLAVEAAEVSRPEVLADATAGELLGVGRAWKSLEGWAFCGKLGVVRELIRRYPAAGDDDPGLEAAGPPDGWDRRLHHEVGAALGISVVAAGKLVELTWVLDNRLPGIRKALEEGHVDPGRARMIADETGVLEREDLCRRAEGVILGGLARCRTWAELLRLVQRAVITADPDGARRRRERAEREEARLRFWREASGTCGLQGTGLPADEALAARAHIEARAQQYKAAGIRRLIDILRIMALADILNGVPAAHRIEQELAEDQARAARDGEQAARDARLRDATRQARAKYHDKTGTSASGKAGDNAAGNASDQPERNTQRNDAAHLDDAAHPDGTAGAEDTVSADGPAGAYGRAGTAGRDPVPGGLGGEDPFDDGPGDGCQAEDGPGDGSPGDGDPGDSGPGDCGPGDVGPADDGPGDGSPGGGGPAGGSLGDGGPSDGDREGGSGDAPGGGGGQSRGAASRSPGDHGGFPDDRPAADDSADDLPGGGSHGDPFDDRDPGGVSDGSGAGGNPLPGSRVAGDVAAFGLFPRVPDPGGKPAGPGRAVGGPCLVCGGAWRTGLPTRANLTIPARAIQWLAERSGIVSGSRDGPGGDCRGGPGCCPACGSRGGERADQDSARMPVLGSVTFPLLTLLGLADRAGEAHGLGALDPALVRVLAASGARHPASEFCVTVVDEHGYAIGHGCCKPARPRAAAKAAKARSPGNAAAFHPGMSGTAAFHPAGRAGPDGGLGSWKLTLPGAPLPYTVDIGPVPTYDCDHRHASAGHTPSRALRHLVQVRDGQCSFPACSRHARDCDYEHARPYDKGGPTCACNAHACSRSCHRVKQSNEWTVTKPRPGWTEWTTMTGRVYQTGPWQYPA